MNKKPSLEEIALAGLLHDIGKFYQRANENSNFLDEKIKQDFCILNEQYNYYGYVHSAFTYDFILQLKNILPDGINCELLARLAASHHKPSSNYEYIITAADRLSAGQDRQSRIFSEDDDKKYYEIPLDNIFSSISLNDKNKKKKVSYKLAPLQADNVFSVDDQKLSHEQYNKLWNSFKNDIMNINILDFDQFYISLLAVLEKYTWCIPASTNNVRDISLYDHLTTTSALASSIFLYQDENNSFGGEETIYSQEEKFLFVSGDLSGIQKYIFDLKTKKYNSKLLRAKSFELQLVSSYWVRRILGIINLPITNRITDAGGRFLLLLPNTQYLKNELDKIRVEIENYFIVEYFAEISLNISTGVSAAADDLKQNNAEYLFRKISLDAEKAKLKKLQKGLYKAGHVINTEYEKIQKQEDICSLCGKRASDKKIFHDEGNICRVCRKLVKLGEIIPKTEYISFLPYKHENGLWLNHDCYILLTDDKSKIPPEAVSYSINNQEKNFGRISLPFYVPSDKNGTLNFEEIIDLEKKENNRPGDMLGMLKADVDNLGTIFSKGMNKGVSISRYATMSRMLNFFFAEGINNEIQSNYKFNSIYVVYAGGDDLCIIGHWNTIIDFSILVNSRFSDFTAVNPDITLSAGIGFGGKNTPVGNLAHISENLLERSKDNVNKDETKIKDSVSLFSTTIFWSEIKDLIENYANWLLDLYKKDKISVSQIYRTLQYCDSAARIKNTAGENIKEKDCLWRSHLAYDAERNFRKNDNKLKEDFVSFIENEIDDLRIPVSYVLYSLR